MQAAGFLRARKDAESVELRCKKQYMDDIEIYGGFPIKNGDFPIKNDETRWNKCIQSIWQSDKGCVYFSLQSSS